MASHLIDFLLIGNNFGTPEMRGVWSEHNRLTKQVEVEVALALAEGELGVIPLDAAKTIAENADASTLNVEEIAKDAARMKHSLMPTIAAIQKQCGAAGEFIHYGVTTQDIVDTATVLQLKQSFDIVVRDTQLLAVELKRLAKKHQHTLMAGRTHGMQALPTTFGFKLAVWLDEFIRHLERLAEIKERVLVGNINGAICTYASFGEQGPEIERLTLDKLGLNTPNIGWQSARDRFSEYASVTVLISGTLGKIGNELYNLMRTEINEIEEPFSEGKIGSTTMPHKRNPAALEGLASLTAPLFKSAALIHESMKVEHERDAMSWRAEWIALPEINIYLSAQLQNALGILRGMSVNEKQMLANLDLQNGLLLSEKVMFEIGKRLGKQTAHHLVYECSMQAFEQNQSFKSVLLAHPVLSEQVIAADLDEWLNPANYVGSAPQKVDDVIRYADNSGLLPA
ncbi:adenylosuccinate lyase [Pectobacterium brasiliense]|uniref:adenylosuccinate lyase n=1 Tax=Pectobacterium brasiliense TaxID=180957 RepID=UPI001CE0D59B|nr:adenylosuccinate lyase [Pectobacterium brasiliense]MCA5920971.1 adenylosuccinate lyase [Pectobacterium brasiliense]MCA5927091.1 adenylosuccinate lyase [Pectobacterium brasiliense]MCA5937114.1 adenylosuccinate lyase [Pectobacterium brasiliense]MCA5941022.1 adenylosuccinate lyase [Pectobacterium brasiliense]MCA5943821.1 adenylosuccinate lyase [Pectobacterium brasiliense]